MDSLPIFEIFDNMNEGVYILNSQGDYIYCNQAFIKMVNGTREDILSLNAFRLVPEGQVSKSVAVMAFEQKKKLSIVNNVLTPKGYHYRQLATATPIFDGAGEVAYMLVETLRLDLFKRRYQQALLNEDKNSVEPMLVENEEKVESLVAKSQAMKGLVAMAEQVALVDATILIGGETGTGKEVLAKVPQLDPAMIDDVIVGCAIPGDKQGYNFARLMVGRAGLPDSVCGMTVNRFCSSGLQAIALGASQIACGVADVIVAGGVESMTACPVNRDISDTFDPELLEIRPEEYMPMGLTAENVAARYGVTRREMEDLAVESHRRAAAAQDAGKFDDEIIPLPGVDLEGSPITFDKDQGIRRDTNVETLAGMKPCFKEGGLVTAPTSSQTSDAAAFVVLMSRAKAEALGIQPIAALEGYAVAGCAPDYMGLGPIYAVPKVLEKTGLTVADMDVVELNEAFAAQAIPCMRVLGLDPAKTNPNGGAMALGHPQGATGAFLTCKALSELKRTGGKYALVTMCIGGGMGAAGIYKMC